MTKPTLDDMWLLAVDDLQHVQIRRDCCSPSIFRELDREIEVRMAICEALNWLAIRKAKAA